jgi:hypothetical protein
MLKSLKDPCPSLYDHRGFFPQLGVICLPHAVAADPVCFYDRDSAAGSDDVLVSRFF